MTASDALRWYENTALAIEPSDETILAQRERFSVVEPRPEPEQMTGDEIAEFLDEHEVGVSWKPASRQTLRVVTLTSDSFPTTKGNTLHEAVCLAAAKLEEINR